MYILGDSFLRSYYSIYDFDNQRVGIAMNIYAKGDMKKKIFPTWAIVLIVIASIIVVALIAYFTYRYFKNKKLASARLHY